VLNEAVHSGLLYAASELATAALALPPRRLRRHLDPAIVRRRRWRAPAACGALLIVVGLSPWQTTGPALNPTVAILWVRPPISRKPHAGGDLHSRAQRTHHMPTRTRA
jgi:hypothetical protein